MAMIKPNFGFELTELNGDFSLFEHIISCEKRRVKTTSQKEVDHLINFFLRCHALTFKSFVSFASL